MNSASHIIGKTYFSYYLTYRLLLKAKPVIIWHQNDATLYCGAGVFTLQHNMIQRNRFLSADKNPSAKSMTILIDASAMPDQPRMVPIGAGLGDKLGPTIIFSSSPKLHACQKMLDESLPSKSRTHILPFLLLNSAGTLYSSWNMNQKDGGAPRSG